VLDVSKEVNGCDSRAVYTPPVVVRISDLKQGAGRCTATGSGDTEGCFRNGNSAAGAYPGCWSAGNSPIQV